MPIRPSVLALAFRFALALVTAFVLAAPGARAQAIVHPNQINGTVAFSNANPVIRAELQALSGPLVVSGSREAPDLGASTREDGAAWLSSTYQLTVEAGDPGLEYAVGAALEVNDTGVTRSYRFPLAVSDVVRIEPAPDVVLDVSECATLVEVAVAPGVSKVTVTARRNGVQALARITNPPTLVRVPIAGDGETREVRVRVEVGTDLATDLMVFEKVFDVTCTCDSIQLLDCSGPSDPGGDGPGAVVGTADILGVDELAPTSVHAMFGPFGNQRRVELAAPPSGPYRLPNMMPSTVVLPPQPYTIIASMMNGAGRRLQATNMRLDGVVVGAGTDTDIGDAFVIDPGTLAGPIELQGPPLLLNPVPGGAWPNLEWTSDTYGTTYRPSATWIGALTAGGSDALSSSCRTEFEGAVDPSGETFRGDYSLRLGGLYRGGADWDAGLMSLRLTADAADGMAPHERMWHSQIIRDRDVDAARIEPGQLVTLLRRHCFGMVTLSVHATDGVFHAPHAEVSGQLVGQDAWAAIRDLTYSGSADGVPESAADAAADGQIILALGEGYHVLRTRVLAHDPAGGVSTTEVLPVEMRVACGQVINAMPGLVIGIDPIAGCRESGSLRVRGSVSAAHPIASITAITEGGAPVTACLDCGSNPTFEVELMAPGTTIVTVKALDAAGNQASVAAATEEAWEPSALDRRPSSVPLAVRREGAQLRLTFEGGVDASVFRGSLASLRGGAYDHRSVACGAMGSAELPDGLGGSYFLVGARCEGATGSLGRDSTGRERPAPRSACD